MDRMELDPNPSPPSRTSSHRSRRSNLSLDLSNIPLLISSTKREPQPTDTLIFAEFKQPEKGNPNQWDDPFLQESLDKLKEWIKNSRKKDKVEAETEAEMGTGTNTEMQTEEKPEIEWRSFVVFKSLNRIIVSFQDEATAQWIRSCWESFYYSKGYSPLGPKYPKCSIFYGDTSSIVPKDQRHLAVPDAGKLWFISPPPSPPHGWESRHEDPPNTMAHAEDLAAALAQLHSRSTPTTEGVPTPVSPADSKMGGFRSEQRSRSSTLIFQPQPQMGNSPDMPCVIVDDMTDEPFEMNPSSGGPTKRPITHTTRPALELMHHA